MKITIVGQGRVGSTLAYTLLLRGLSDELVLLNRRRKIAEGESLDLQHAEAFISHPTVIRPGGVDETAGSDIIIICSSVPWNQKYTSRFDIGYDNLKMIREVIPPLAKASPDAKVLVITNPVDVMTYHAIKLTGFGPKRVFGTGTLIDSARFRTMLSVKMGIHPDDLRVYILGEHGDTQFPLFSKAMAGGGCILESKATHKIFRKASRAGFDVVHQKGHTNFAISMAATLVIEAMVWDTRRTIPLSVLVDGFMDVHDVCLSLPVVVGKDGINQVLEPDLEEGEVAAFQKCAAIVREGIERSLGNMFSKPDST
ncbi:MAG: lactate dehydrogenase [Thermodesulfobacteriota bacterium]|nr:lactate dehydrogenase [Thermodesulfobacteriota bacterium]